MTQSIVRCRRGVPALVAAVLVAAAPAAPEAVAQSFPPPGATPEERRAWVQSRLDVITSRGLDLLARSEYPAAGEAPLTEEEAAEARAVNRALAARYGMAAPLPDDALRRRLSAVLVPLSEDQRLAFDRDMERFAAASEPDYVAQLRRARRLLDDAAVESLKLELDGAPMLSSPMDAIGLRVLEIVTQAAITHAAARAARVVEHGALLADGQQAAFAVVAEAVHQDHLQRLLQYSDHRLAAFDPIRALADVAEQEGVPLAGAEHAPWRTLLVQQLAERRAIVLAAARGEVRVRRAGRPYFERARAGERITADDPDYAAYQSALESAAALKDRLAAINERIVTTSAEHLGGELGRAYRRHHRHACWPWMARVEPVEWEAARAAVLEADVPASVTEALGTGAAVVVAARDELLAEWEVEADRFRRTRTADMRSVPELHQRLADRYLQWQRMIERAVQDLHAAVLAAVADDPALAPLSEELAGHVAASAAARRQAADLAERGEVPWAMGIVGWRPTAREMWTRGE